MRLTFRYELRGGTPSTVDVEPFAIIAATPSGFTITSVDPPRADGTTSQGATLEADVNLTAQVKEG